MPGGPVVLGQVRPLLLGHAGDQLRDAGLRGGGLGAEADHQGDRVGGEAEVVDAGRGVAVQRRVRRDREGVGVGEGERGRGGRLGGGGQRPAARRVVRPRPALGAGERGAAGAPGAAGAS